MKKRLVIIGGGFAGLQLIQNISKDWEVFLIDRQNYHQFQPLLYQVAIGEIEPSSILFPYRNLFSGKKNIHFINGEIQRIEPEAKKVFVEQQNLDYDALVLAMGTENNFFNQASFKNHCLTLKSLDESVHLRNQIFTRLEEISQLPKEYQADALQWVIIGAGPTGIELGAILSQMRFSVFQREYPEIDFSQMCLHLIEAGSRILAGMSEKSSNYAQQYLEKIGLKIHLQTLVKSCTTDEIILQNDQILKTGFTLWTAGVQARTIEGLTLAERNRTNRILVDRQHQVKNYFDIYCIGDQALMSSEAYPQGHPQVAQVALQQGKNLAKILNNPQKTYFFTYKNKGSMAILGKQNAVVDLQGLHFSGIFAWFLWSFVHIFSIIGVKNKISVFINWVFFYFSKRNNLRIITRKN